MSTELSDRTEAFAQQVHQLVSALPPTGTGRLIAGQINRSAAAVGEHYRAACAANSHVDFLEQLGLAEEEVRETAAWLELISLGGLLSPPQVARVQGEIDDIAAFLAGSRTGILPAPG